MKALLLAALLCASVAPLGTLITTVQTADGDVTVYRSFDGCQILFRGVLMQTVTLQTCAA